MGLFDRLRSLVGGSDDATEESTSDDTDEEPISWDDTEFEQLAPEETEATGFEQLASELAEADEEDEGEPAEVNADATTETTDASGTTAESTGDVRLPLDTGPAVDDAADQIAHEVADVPEGSQRAEFVADARELVDFWSEYEFDCSVESLAQVDAYVDDQWGPERFRDVEFGGEDYDSAVYTEQVRQIGGYLGEVLVREREGEWVQREGIGWVVEHGADGEAVPVFHLVQECLAGEATVVDTVGAVIDDYDA